MIPSLLVVGAGPLQIPAMHEARALGIRTVAVDGNPSAVGLAWCDAPYVADILDAEAVCAIAKREGIDGVMTLCTDAAVSTVAEVGDRMSLTVLSRRSAARATDKRLMREAFAESGAPSPRTRLIHSWAEARAAAESFGYPVVLKIGRGSGSRGIYRIEDSEEIPVAYARCRAWQNEGPLLLEEWVDGGEVSVEGYCTDRERSIVAITDKFLFAGGSLVEAGHCQPSMHAGLREQQIQSCVQAGLSALELSWCAFHAEVKVSTEGAKLIEIGARLGGDRISTHLTPLSTGVNLVRVAILLALGQRPQSPRIWDRAACVRYFDVQRAGTLSGVDGLGRLHAIPGVEIVYPASERDGILGGGFVIGEIRSSLDRYGHILYSAATRHEAIARCELAASRFCFQFEDGDCRNGLGRPW
ncbi:MAG: ATP-grasp domain-containing protein [Acidobacteriaceae bacterium]